MNVKLTAQELIYLHKCEETIAGGITIFYAVGKALSDIKEKRLYREIYPDFETYCNERWDLDRTYAYRLINAFCVADNLLPIGNIPENESQARPLVPLTPDEQRTAWGIVLKTAPDGKVTAAHVKSVTTVFKNAVKTGALDPGTGEEIPIESATAFHWIQAVGEETYERYQRQKTHILENVKKEELKQLPLTLLEIQLAISTITANPADQEVAKAVRSILRIQERKTAS